MRDKFFYSKILLRKYSSKINLLKGTVFFRSGGGLLLAAIILVSIPITVLLFPTFQSINQKSFSPVRNGAPVRTASFCTSMPSQSDCESNGCFWQNGSCIDFNSSGGIGGNCSSYTDRNTCQTNGCVFHCTGGTAYNNYCGTGYCAPSVDACTSSGGNRMSCSAIQGTTYCSDAERAWYLANCVSSGGGGSTGGGTCTPNFPGGYSGLLSFCRNGGADTVNNSCTDCACSNGKPWPNADNNCVISGGGGGTSACGIGSSGGFASLAAANSYCQSQTGGLANFDTATCYCKCGNGTVLYSGVPVSSCNSLSPTPTSGGAITPSNLHVTAPTCWNTDYSATLSWTGSGNGWYVDISTDPNFGGFNNKNVSNTTSTVAPAGFSLGLALHPNTAYYWRVWNGVNHTVGQSFKVPTCPSGGTGGTGGSNNGGSGGTGGNGGTGSNGGITPPATNTPTPSATPTPTSTLTPTLRATLSPTNIPGTTSTITPTSSPTLAQGQTGLHFDLELPGVGGSEGGANPNPVKKTMNVQVKVFDLKNNQVADTTGILTWGQSQSGFASQTQGPHVIGYIGTVALPNNIQTGLYKVKVRFENTLWKRIDYVTINQGVPDNGVKVTTLVVGDLNQDNVLDLADYNIVLTCYGRGQCARGDLADFNLDGKVDELDVNILYSELATREGD